MSTKHWINFINPPEICDIKDNGKLKAAVFDTDWSDSSIFPLISYHRSLSERKNHEGTVFLPFFSYVVIVCDGFRGAPVCAPIPLTVFMFYHDLAEITGGRMS